jgi:hypothetical protein
MTPFNFNNLYAAFHNQVVSASGLAANRVIWGAISGDTVPLQNYITLQVVETQPLHQLTEDGVFNTVGSPSGQEVTLTTKEHFEISIQIQAFSVTKPGQYSAAPAMLENIRSFFGKESTRAAFETVKTAIIDRGTVRHLPTVLNTMFESRGVLEIRLRGASGSEETTTNIETVDYTLNVTT